MKKKAKSTTVTMFEGAPPKLFRYSKENRNNPTLAESRLWEMLKCNQLSGYKFRRQHPMGNFILDFYCHQKKLAIELDGDYHFTPEQEAYDMYRTTLLQYSGVTVIRFLNDQVLKEMDWVLAEILKAIEQIK